VLAVCVAAMASYELWIAIDWKTKGEFREEIRRELPRGSTEDDIRAYLDAQGAGYSRGYAQAREVWDLRDEPVDPDARVISALVRDTKRASLLGWTGHTQLYFVLAADGTLDAFYVYEVFDSL